MLQLRDVHTYYGNSHVLQGVSLDALPGQVVCLLGRNGAGKTTLIRSVMGWTPPRRGTVLVHGQDVVRWPPFRIARLGVGIVPQGRRIFPNLTVRENLLIGVRGGGEAANGVERIYAFFPRLGERDRHRAGHLSGGEQSMLAVGRALMTGPRLLLLDEPSEGLAPRVVWQIASVLRRLRDEGMAILLVEQNTALALAVADTVRILQKGRIAYEGEPERLRADRSLLERYLSV